MTDLPSSAKPANVSQGHPDISGRAALIERMMGPSPLPRAIKTVNHALVDVVFVYQVAQAHLGRRCLLTLCRRHAGLTNGG